MSTTLNHPQSAIEAARQVIPALANFVPEIERECRLPHALMQQMHQARLFRMLLPRAVGGDEVEPALFLQVLEEIARVDASTAWCICQTSVCSTAASLLEEAVGRAVFGGADAVLAMGYGSSATAVRVPGGYRVTGNWGFASGGRNATWFGGACTIDGPEPTTRAMLFAAVDVELTPSWDTIGLKGTGSDSYAVANLFVPEGYSFVMADRSAQTCGGALYRFSPNSLWAGGFASVALGVATSMLEALMDLATQKTARGAARPLAETPSVQSVIARNEAGLDAARLLLREAFRQAWLSANGSGQVNLGELIKIRLAASHAIQQAKVAAEQCYDAAGVTAIFAAQPFERRLRDIRAISQHLHGRQSHFELVGQFMLGLPPDTTFI